MQRRSGCSLNRVKTPRAKGTAKMVYRLPPHSRAVQASRMKHILLISTLVFSSHVLSWDGYDYESGSDVEIEQGNLVRPGEEIEFYDYGSGEYRYGDVESINDNGSSVEVEVYDQESGEYRTFEMED